jgi:hypothetical protein
MQEKAEQNRVFLAFVEPVILLRRALLAEQSTRSQGVERYSNVPPADMRMTLT